MKMLIESEVVKQIEKIANELGCPVFTRDRKKRLRGKVSLSILFIMMIESFLSIITSWQNLNARFEAMEDFVVLLFAFSITNELWKSPEYLKVKLSVMEGKITKFNKINTIVELIDIDYTCNDDLTLSKDEIKLRKKVFDDQVPIKNWFIIIVSMFVIINAVLPMLFSIIHLKTASGEIKNEDLFMPFECSLPFTMNGIHVYMVVATIQIVGMMVFSASAFCWFTSTVCSLLAIGSEMELLCVSIKNIDDKVNERAVKLKKPDSNKYQKMYERDLYAYLIYLIQHHQAIIRAVKMLNESLSWSILLFNQVCCVQFCLSLYGFFEREDKSSKLKYLLLLVPVFWCFTLFCSYGQQLTDKSVSLAAAIAESSWINKPEWFKKNLYFMLKRAQQPLEIIPLRLYTLNFKNMMTVLQAAYSYFNLMHTLKKKNY